MNRIAAAISVASKLTSRETGRSGLARRLNGEEIEAEEDPGGDAEGVAERACGLQFETLGEQRRSADEAEAEPGEDAAGDALAQDEPPQHHDPDRGGGGEEGRIGDAGVDDGEMPEEKVAGKGEPRQDRRLGEPLAGPLRPVGETHPGVEQRQGERDAPESATARRRRDGRKLAKRPSP